MKKQLQHVFIIFILIALLLTACAAPATEAPVVQEPAAQEPAAQAEPTKAPEPTAVLEPVAAEKKLILATTTSTQDSGLLDFILPDFEQEFGIRVDVIAVGTGQAIQLGQDGNADVLLVHARAREDEFMANGHGVRREDVMYNDFVIVGPASDPAGIKGMTNAADALKLLAEKQATFVSRGDDSGTHTKELSIWKKAALEPSGDWYVSAGQGMGEVLTMAKEQQGYTLSDRATYLAMTLEGLDLEVLVEGDAALFNPYGVIAVNPDKNANIQNDLANTFIDWLISLPVQEKIASFGVDKFGQSLFVPDSAAWREAHPVGQPAAEAAAAEIALKFTGLVEQEIGWTEAEVRALPTTQGEAKNNKGEADTQTGVLVTDLLKLVSLKAEAATLVFVDSSGGVVEAALADVQACTNCLVTFRNNGGFSLLMPFMSEQLVLKGLTEIQVK